MYTQGMVNRQRPSPLQGGQRRLRTKAGPRTGPGLNRGQGGERPTVSELGREPSAQTPTGLQMAPGGGLPCTRRCRTVVVEGPLERQAASCLHLCSCSQEARSSWTVLPPREAQETSKGPEHHWSEQAGAGGLDLRKDGTQPPFRMQGLLEAGGSLCPIVQLQTEA